MLQRTLTPAVRRPGRPSPAPPVILRSPGETLEGSEVLDEVRGALGVLLWRALRSATLWAAVRPSARACLFAPAARERWLGDAEAVSAEAPLRDPLRVFGSLLASPGGVAAERVARACTQVAEWAEGTGAQRTALAFAQAAATAMPGSPPTALAAALRAEQVGQDVRGETWLRRALVLSRARRDRATQAHASLHLARILERRGEEGRAARMYARTARLARTTGLRMLRAQALREMGALAGRSAPAADQRPTARE